MKMSKLFKFKKFFTVEEAREYLSAALEEPISMQEIYRLVLDKHLTLSVRLVNQGYARVGYFFKHQEDNCYHRVDYDPITDKPLNETYLVNLADCLPLQDGRWINFSEKVYAIDGVWDLAMIGMESTDIECLYQKEIGDVEPFVASLRGIFLTRDKRVCKLKKKRSPKNNNKNRVALNQTLKQILEPKGLTFDDLFEGDKVNKRLTNTEIDHISDLYRSMQDDEELSDDEKYEDSLALEENSHQLIIKKHELTRFIQSADDTPQEAKPLHDKERTTLLLLLASILKKANLELDELGLVGRIRKATEFNKTPVAAETIRNLLPLVRDIVELKQKE